MGAAMPRETRVKYPGQPDISNQFSAGNIRRTLADYRSIRTGDGNYAFGELTARYYHLDQNQRQAWEDDLRTYPKAVQDEIKRHIIYALKHKDSHGKDSPIPITFKWSAGSKKVTVTYDPSLPSYKIEIFGYPTPTKSPFAKRRGTKKK
jgi:hypothetical protein